MTPLFACFPVCMTFVGIALVGLVVVVLDLANRPPADEQPASGPATDPAATGKTGPPPWWVMVLMVVAIAVTMLVLRWYWPE